MSSPDPKGPDGVLFPPLDTPNQPPHFNETSRVRKSANFITELESDTTILK